MAQKIPAAAQDGRREVPASAEQGRGDAFGKGHAQLVEYREPPFRPAAVAAGEFANLREAAAEMVHVDRVYAPNPEYAAIYDRKYARYQRAEDAVRKLFAEEDAL